MSTELIISIWGLWIWLELFVVIKKLNRITDALDKHIEHSMRAYALTQERQRANYGKWTQQNKFIFLLAMIQRFGKEFGNVCMQLENLKDEKNKVLTDLEKRYLKDRLETILEYLG